MRRLLSHFPAIFLFISFLGRESIVANCFVLRGEARHRSFSNKTAKQEPSAFLAKVSVLLENCPQFGVGVSSRLSNSIADENDNDSDCDDGHAKSILRRMNFCGISVSNIGFLLLLTTPDAVYSADDDELNSQSMVTLPIRVSIDPQDANAATSIEALTLIQLMSGIDMAGAVFPPQLLSNLVALKCSTLQDEHTGVDLDSKELSPAEELVLSAIRKGLPEDIVYYEANSFQRGRVKLPKVTLTGVKVSLPSTCLRHQVGEHTDSPLEESTLDELLKAFVRDVPLDKTSLKPLPLQFTLQCLVENDSLEVPLFSEELPPDRVEIQDNDRRDGAGDEEENGSSTLVVEEAAFSYNPASAAFIALGLALRYGAPVVMDGESLDAMRGALPDSPLSPCCIVSPAADVDSGISQSLPRWRSLAAMQDQSSRVETNLERGFEMSRLESALKIALERGDAAAAERIRKAFARFQTDDLSPNAFE